MMTKRFLVALLVATLLLVAAVVMVLAAGEGYAEGECGHFVSASFPDPSGASGIWFTSDPAHVQSASDTFEMLGRGLVVAYSSVELGGVAPQNVWGCHFTGTMPQSRKMELLEGEGLIPAWYVEVGTSGNITSQFVETPWTPEPTPDVPPTEEPTPEPSVVVFFNANSSEGYGEVITTAMSFDLIAVVYPQVEITTPVTLTFEGVSPAWGYHTAEGLGGDWVTHTVPVYWTGAFPSEGPVEVWATAPAGSIPFRGCTIFGLLVEPAGEKRSVVVCNPLWGVNLPLVLRGY